MFPEESPVKAAAGCTIHNCPIASAIHYDLYSAGKPKADPRRAAPPLAEKEGGMFMMRTILDHPFAVLALSLVAMLIAALIGVFFRVMMVPVKEDQRQDFGIVLPATLTLLGLIIGFSFSMATGRYDQRKNDEEAEANAIGTEYLRADLLSASDAGKVRELLKNYLDQRVRFYETRDDQQLAPINAQTEQLQSELWSIVQAAAAKQPTYPVGLAVSGMNDVLNSQGYTQAAWWYRLPAAAWALMAAIAVFSTLLIGYSSHRRGITVFAVLPVAISIAFFLIADIESPRHGLIRVVPQNLVSLSQSLRPQ
jgi:protein-S-isoprenylcysteine O-methyltransferase Ste14